MIIFFFQKKNCFDNNYLIFGLLAAEISAVVCDKEEKSMTLMNDKNEMPTLKVIIQIDPISEAAKKKSRELDVDLISFKEMEVSH